uniref:Uncharacterized protein n=1 Tax=viral metagenome TaxID=1070528 RepID=A0A6H1ZHA6_9ZZZZ
MTREELPRCSHIFRYSKAEDTPMRCTDQARYHLTDLRRPSQTADACMAHLAQVFDRLGEDRQWGEYVPILVRRINDNPQEE